MRLVPERNEQNSFDENIIEVDSMLIRDFFAGMVIAGIIAHSYSSDTTIDAFADDAYRIADEMMERRWK